MNNLTGEIDLRYHLALGVENMINSLDERRGYIPFFNFELIQKPVYLKHGSFDSPHVTGRYLDALSRCSSIIELPKVDEVYDALANQLYESVQRHPSGLPWNLPARWLPDLAAMHNCREVLLGFIALHNWRKDDRAISMGVKFCKSILNILGKDSHFRGEAFGIHGWTMSFNGLLSSPPATTGRMIRALIQFYRLSGEDEALELAKRFVLDNLQSAFTEDGRIKPEAGQHVHSILGTITGLLEYGILTGNQVVIDRARQIFDVGIQGLHSSFGWAKENIWLSENPSLLRKSGYREFDIPRGEANNTADLVEIALLLGNLGYTEYFDQADKFVRNHLLASQVIDTSWIKKGNVNLDTEEKIFTDIARRVRGGFCFGSPNDIISYPEEPHQVNTDLVGGACQGLCEAWDSITHFENNTLVVNLLFSKTDETLHLTCPGGIDEPIIAHLKTGSNFAIRIPSWVKSNKVFIQMNQNEKMQAHNMIRDGYLKVESLNPDSIIKIWFPAHREKVIEEINGKEYEVEWTNGTVARMAPEAHYHALYGR